MLNFMRKHAGSWLIKILLGAIIIVFIFFYGWGFKERKDNIIASVNGSTISLNEYRKNYENLVKMYRNTEGFSPELMKTLNLGQVAIDSLVNKVLVLQEVKKLRLEVGRAELQRHISQIPYLQKNGVFDTTTYLRFLRYSRRGPEEFEEEQKQIMLIEKVQNLLKDSVKLSGQEAYDTYAAESEKVGLKFIRFKPSQYEEKTDPSKTEIEDYFMRHSNDYTVPSQVKVNYLCFEEEDFLEAVSIDPHEIKEYYDLNLKEFIQPKKVKVRHILVKTTPQDDSEVVAAKKKKAEEALKEIETGMDFSFLAKIYSEGPSATRGGDLGYIERGQTVKPFEDIAFSLKEGEVSSLVRTIFGFHIIKAESIVEERTKPLEEAREEIISRLKKEKAQLLSVDTAEEVADLIYLNDDLKAIAREKNLSFKTTEYFALQNDIPGIGEDNAFVSQAFSLEEGEVSPLFESQGKHYLVKLIDKLSARKPELTEVEAEVKAALNKERAKEKARKSADEFLNKIKKMGRDISSLSSLASQEKIKIEETDLFTQGGDTIPQIGVSRELKDAAFSLTSQKPFFDKVLRVGEEYLVIYLKERKGVTREDYEKVREGFNKMLLEKKRESIIKVWMDNLRKKADIEINQDLLLDS